MTSPPILYLDPDTIIGLQDRLIEDYGGIPGLKGGKEGYNLVASAAARPMNKAAYEGADLQTQAAALMFGLAKNHAFNDGNKRVSFAATHMMLLANSYRFVCDSDTAAGFLEGCSDPEWTEERVATFIKANSEPF